MAKKMKNGKGFLWISTRIGFWSIIALWIIMAFVPYENVVYALLSFLWIGLTIFTFVSSILHLTKYESKAFAITALVISSILLLLFIIGMIIGVLSLATISGNFIKPI